MQEESDSHRRAWHREHGKHTSPLVFDHQWARSMPLKAEPGIRKRAPCRRHFFLECRYERQCRQLGKLEYLHSTLDPKTRTCESADSLARDVQLDWAGSRKYHVASIVAIMSNAEVERQVKSPCDLQATMCGANRVGPSLGRNHFWDTWLSRRAKALYGCDILPPRNGLMAVDEPGIAGYA